MSLKIPSKFFKFYLIKDYIFRTILFLVQFIFYHRKEPNRSEIERILIIRLTHHGDFILTLPVLQLLKDEFPDAGISLVIASWNRSLAEEFNDHFTEVYFYNVSKYCRQKQQRMSLTQRWEVIKEICGKKFDLIIDLDSSTGFLVPYLLKRTRFLSSTEYLRFLQNLQQLRLIKNQRTEYNIYTNHELFNLTQTLKHLGIHSNYSRFNFQNKFETENRIAGFFVESQISVSEPLVGIHPSASDEKRFWPVDHFASLSEELIRRFKVQILFFGAPADRQRIHAIQSKMSSRSFEATTLNLPQFVAAVRRCDLLICQDSLAQHVAFLWLIPAIVLYFQDNFRRWAPANNSDFFSIIYNESGITINEAFQKLPVMFKVRIKEKNMNIKSLPGKV